MSTKSFAQDMDSLLPLKKTLIQVSCYKSYLSQNEDPFIPEIQHLETHILGIVLECIQAEGGIFSLRDPRYFSWFKFVFRRGITYTYQWYQSSEGTFNPNLSTGGPYNDEQYLILPQDKKEEILDSDVPKAMLDTLFSWLLIHDFELADKDIAPWKPLLVALSVTFQVAESLGRKMFGERM